MIGAARPASTTLDQQAHVMSGVRVAYFNSTMDLHSV
jgi:hypothetical protein